ncbi:MAG: hypothetical protein EOO24_15925 [Comamonadaceae bacterium]|nr:MAG: hypothetical protein EOO24_15925 [Comamonadaceae bacterium]
MNRLRSRIGKSPRHATILGKALLLAGAILILGAVFARAGLIGINGDRTQAKLPAFQTLAEAYPQYPTWFVPEGPLGYTIAALLVLAGMALVALAEDALKKERAQRAARF